MPSSNFFRRRRNWKGPLRQSGDRYVFGGVGGVGNELRTSNPTILWVRSAHGIMVVKAVLQSVPCNMAQGYTWPQPPSPYPCAPSTPLHSAPNLTWTHRCSFSARYSKTCHCFRTPILRFYNCYMRSLRSEQKQQLSSIKQFAFFKSLFLGLNYQLHFKLVHAISAYKEIFITIGPWDLAGYWLYLKTVFSEIYFISLNFYIEEYPKFICSFSFCQPLDLTAKFPDLHNCFH